MSGEVMVPEPSPPRSETLQGLAARVEAATGPDRVLDVLLNVLTGDRHDDADDARRMAEPYEADPTGYAEDRYTTTAADEWGIPRYTASLDAALGLVERVTAGWVGPIELSIAGSAQAMIASNDPCGWYVQRLGPTPPLALLSALLEALANRPETPE